MKLAVLGLMACLVSPLALATEYTTVVPGQSRVDFEFRQMGVPIKGGFKRFTVQMAFDPARPETARATIEIDLASIDAGSREADEESAGRLWFNRSVHPKATFVSSQVRALGNNRFELRGTLTLKGTTRDLVIPVTYTPGRTASRFEGNFVLRRLEYGIGEGMWTDVSAVANEIPVRFRIAATRK